DRQNALQIARVDGRVGPNRPQAIVPKGGKELLGHRTVVTKLARIVAVSDPLQKSGLVKDDRCSIANDDARREIAFAHHVVHGIDRLSSPKIPTPYRHNSGAAGALILLTVP